MSYPSFRKCKIAAGAFRLFAVLKDTTRMAGTEGREGGGRRKRLGLKGLCTWGGGGKEGVRMEEQRAPSGESGVRSVGMWAGSSFCIEGSGSHCSSAEMRE